MNLVETSVAAVITVSVAATTYLVVDPAAQGRRAEVVAEQATCRTVNSAVVAYVSDNGVAPGAITDLQPYVQGDISAYRIEDGLAAGPGCPVAAPR